MSSEDGVGQYQYRNPDDVNGPQAPFSRHNTTKIDDTTRLERPTTPSLQPRPNSRIGVNFSRPTTLYKVESNEEDEAAEGSDMFHSPQSSPRAAKSSSPTHSVASNTNKPSLSIRPVHKQNNSVSRASLRSPVDLPPSLQPGQRISRTSLDYQVHRLSNSHSHSHSHHPNSDLVPPRTSSLSRDHPPSSINESSNSSSRNAKYDRHISMVAPPKSQAPNGDIAASSSKGPTNKSGKQAKICQKCGQPISGQFVRALNAAYHIDCFACADCGALCSSKFFPIDAPHEMQEKGTTQIPLCEKDYFKRLELLCYVCDGALRGSYITALGRKYHVEHFTCSMCSTVFGPDDSYYEYQDSIYCHFHYSTLFASRCEGCKTAILKQFVEIYRGGKEQQWHPECYMIFKFWNVKLSPEGGAPSINPLRPLSISVNAPLDKLSRDQVTRHEKLVDEKVLRVWTVLCGYEEATASYISDMLQTASTGRFQQSLAATMKLVAKIEVLFDAIDNVCALIDPIIQQEKLQNPDGDTTYTSLGKEAKTLCKKVVGFMSLISKSREKGVKRMGITQELLNLVTSLAHYLKLLIRYGLSNSLQYDRQHLDGHAVDRLLDQITTHEKTPADPLVVGLGVSAMTSDHCYSCDLSVEDRCARLSSDRRWHLSCMSCSKCGAVLGIDENQHLMIDEARWSSLTKRLFCVNCAPAGDSRGGFVLVPKLSQFVYLLKIAVARLQLVLNALDTRDKKAAQAVGGAPAGLNNNASATLGLGIENSPSSDFTQNDKGYMTTLTDIRRLRSTKLDQQVSESSRRARRSKILDLPDSEQAMMSKNDSTQSLNRSPESQQQQDRRHTDRQLKIEDDFDEDAENSRLDRTTDLFRNEKSLTLDDIPRIVAAEQARELRPNAYRHQSRSASTQKTLETRTVSAPRKERPNRKFLSELTDVELFAVRHFAVLQMEKMLNGWYSLDDLLELIEVKKNSSSLWGKFGKAFGGDRKDKNKKKTGVFGVSLDVLVDKYGVDSTLGVGPGPLRIPAFVDDCITSMRQKDMSVEGVFRKNGNIRRLKEFTEKIDKQPDSCGLLTEESPVQLAALLKKFLRELPEPLMTSKLLKLWIAAQRLPDENQRKKLLHLTCCLLPKTHRDTLEVLFYFLNWTASFSHIDEETGSKMDSHNLATVITPNILYIKDNGQNGAADSGDAYFLSIESVNVLIEEQASFAEVPLEITVILQHTNLAQATSEVTTKEILSRYEQFKKDDAAQAALNAVSQLSVDDTDSAPGSNTESPANGAAAISAATTPSPSMGGGGNRNHSAAVRTSTMTDVETMSTAGSRPGPIRVDTEFAQRVAQDQEMYTSINRVHENSPSTASPHSPRIQ